MQNSALNKCAARETRVNGIDAQALGETAQAIRQNPELGAAHFRVRNRWLNGNKNQSSVTGFYGAKQEFSHKQEYLLLADEPPVLAGEDDAPNPVEHMLHALASCVTTSMVAHAAVRGIRLEEVESEIEGDIDLRGYLGTSNKVPRGYTDIRVKFTVKAPGVDPELLNRLSKFSPVFNTITQGANVDIEVETI